MDNPQGKGKKTEFNITQPLRPVHHDPDFHTFVVEYRVELATGIIHFTYICQDCPLRAERVYGPMPDFRHHIREDNSED